MTTHQKVNLVLFGLNLGISLLLCVTDKNRRAAWFSATMGWLCALLGTL